MLEHLSQDLVERYRFRTMSKAELISADEHLASCGECRAMLANREDLRAQVDSLRADFEKSVVSEHLDYEQLEAYIDETLGTPEREALDSHCKSCASCSAELRDLQAFKNQSGEQKTRPRVAASNAGFAERGLVNQVLLGLRAAWRPTNRWALVAFALIALAVAIRTAWEWPLRPSSIVHGPEKAPVSPIINKPPETALSSYSYLPPEIQAVVADALNNQHIQTPLGFTDLAVRRGGADVSFPLLAPVGTVVYGTTPVFRWKAVSNADGYRVRVSDSRQNPVESSPVVTGTSWKSTVTLRRGATYVWRVFIIVDGAEAEESSLDVSQGHFKVLDEAQLQQVNAVNPEDHLARGILLVHAGVLEQAVQEFRAVSPSDANHSFATKFERQAQEMIVRQREGLMH